MNEVSRNDNSTIYRVDYPGTDNVQVIVPRSSSENDEDVRKSNAAALYGNALVRLSNRAQAFGPQIKEELVEHSPSLKAVTGYAIVI